MSVCRRIDSYSSNFTKEFIGEQIDALVILLRAGLEKLLELLQRLMIEIFLQQLLVLLSLNVLFDGIDTRRHLVLSPTALNLRQSGDKPQRQMG